MRMLLLLTALLPVAATAQSTTNCQTIGGFTRCQTDPQPRGPDPSQFGTFRIQPPPANYRGDTPSPAPQHADKNARVSVLELGRMMADGRCREALDAALRQGDIEIAGRIRDYCERVD